MGKDDWGREAELAGPSDGDHARPPTTASLRSTRRRIALLLVAAFGAIGLLGAARWAAGALRAVEAVEAERDSWQRPGEVVSALALGQGQVVADLGSGVGYFALKLTNAVGARGRVLAVDVRSFPLLFLRLRAIAHGRRNLELVRAAPDDPRLPAGGVDAVLVVNTFHELEHPARVLARVREALHPGGRLVVVDPGPGPGVADTGLAGQAARHPHDASPAAAEVLLRQAGLEILGRDDGFINHPGRGRWWLIVARRPPGG